MIKKLGIIIVLIILTITLVGCNITQNEEKTKFKIMASFYPIKIMLLNICEGIEDVKVENMVQSNVTCLHDYSLSTEDLLKCETANVFVKNGLGLEEFADKIVETYSDIKVIDSSKNVVNLIKEDEEVNGHIWTSVENYIIQVETIAEELAKIDTVNAEKYKQNASNYIQKLKKLQEEITLFSTESKVISFNESLEYLLKEFKIEEITVHTHHEEVSLSAEELTEVIEYGKQNEIKAIIVDKNEINKSADLVKNELQGTIYQLDSYLVGEDDKDSYINAVKSNLEILKNI